jgi:Arc/MetJ-type ribon-helix-helix transcriptional regulator
MYVLPRREPIMTITVKLDAALEEQLRAHVAGSGSTTSEVIRAALVAYLENAQASRRAAPPSAYELGVDLFGRHRGEPGLAQGRKRLLAEAWSAKHAARPR